MQLVHDREIASFVNTAIKLRNPSKEEISDPLSTILPRQNYHGVKTGVQKSRAPGHRGDKFLRCRLIHPALLLRFFTLTPLANLHHFLIWALTFYNCITSKISKPYDKISQHFNPKRTTKYELLFFLSPLMSMNVNVAMYQTYNNTTAQACRQCRP
jgi:hypothetical protein